MRIFNEFQPINGLNNAKTYTDQVRRNDTIRHYHNVNYACHTTHWSQLHGALQG